MSIKLNAIKKNYLSTTGEVKLFIEDVTTTTRNGTKILILKCTTENEKGEIFHYNKEFSLSVDGQPYLVEFLNQTKMLTQKQQDNFKPEMLLGKEFFLSFFLKDNKKYPHESQNEYYMVEMANSAKPITID
jgi:hypothetical protein